MVLLDFGHCRYSVLDWMNPVFSRGDGHCVAATLGWGAEFIAAIEQF